MEQMDFENKRQLRRHALGQRRGMSHDARAEESRKIADQLFQSKLYRDSRTVFCYVSVEDEVHTELILDRVLSDGKRLCIPYILDSEQGLMAAALLKSLDMLKPGVYGILTVGEPDFVPVEPEAIDLVIVPGVAFDLHGHRIGMGGGYYDRFLRQAADASRLAIAYECQVFHDLPVEQHDISVDYLVTGNRYTKLLLKEGLK